MTKYTYYGGSFDLFHLGHLKALKKAKKIANKNNTKLLVVVNTDGLYRNYKEKEPIIPYKYRKEIIESLSFVDKVVPKRTFSDMELLQRYNVKVFIICKEWDTTKTKEKEYMKRVGGKVYRLPYYKGISASEIRDKIINNYRQKERILCEECHRKI